MINARKLIETELALEELGLPAQIQGLSTQVNSIQGSSFFSGRGVRSVNGTLPDGKGDVSITTSSALTITEVDGAPSGTPSTLKFTNGSVTDNGDGSFTITTGAGGGGDFSSNTSTSVDSEIVLFSGTGGKTGKRAAGTGVAIVTSGVLSTKSNPTGAFVGTTDTQTLSSKTLDNTDTVTLKDTNFTLQDDGDTTKQLIFQLSGITTATTRTITLPDASGTATLLGNASTGSGSIVLQTSPTLITPVLGVAAATTINKVTITTPATGSTLTIADGKTLTVSNTLTFTGTDTSSIAFGGGGTVAYTANNLSVFAATTSAQLAGVISDETGTGLLVFNNTPTLTTPVINGTVTGTGVGSATGVSTLAQRDANSNSQTNNWIQGYTTTVTAAGTTVLDVTSSFLQFFTGTTTQTVTLPVTSTLVLGQQYYIRNNSTGLVTVNSSGGNLIRIIAGGTRAVFTCILTSGTTAASWSSMYVGISITDGKVLSVSNSLTLAGTDATTMTFPTTSATIARTDAANTFTGVQTFSSSPVLSTGALTSGGNTITMPGAADTLVGRATTDTLTNKRITKRIETLADAATVTPASDSNDGGLLATLSQTTTIANPTGTPTNFQQYILRIKSISAQTLSFGTQFRAGTDVSLPATTTGSSKTDYYGFQWNSADSKWDILAKTTGF